MNTNFFRANTAAGNDIFHLNNYGTAVVMNGSCDLQLTLCNCLVGKGNVTVLVGIGTAYEAKI